MSANTEVLNKRNKGSSMVLSKAIDNLVDNALVYGCPNGGKNDIEIILDNTVAHFYVQDYGVGISPELITKALERFVYGTNINGEGSDLGLSVAKNTIELHDGGVGASFKRSRHLCAHIKLPLQVD
ncbi:MAG: HAMP domain-containing histidine kinase [Candidatus Thioglobus sp.]|nr:HAMP domain-containing histidine kinase [Candidatus Thioglobus sp.]